MDVIVSVSAQSLTSAHIGVEVYLPRVNVKGVLSDLGGSLLYVGGQVVEVKHNDRVVF